MDNCNVITRSAHQQLEQSPKPLADLTTQEHQVAQKLAADSHILLGGMGRKESATHFINAHNAALKDMQDAIGKTDKSRLDGILADANSILSPADAKLVQADNGGTILGKKGVIGYNLATPVTGDFKCQSDYESNLFPGKFQLIDRYNRERMLNNF